MEVANTILYQIKTLDKFALISWGAKNLLVLESGLQFKTSGLVKNKGYVRIKLNGIDLYDIEFGKVRKLEYKILNKVENVYAEDMVRIIDGMVG